MTEPAKTHDKRPAKEPENEPAKTRWERMVDWCLRTWEFCAEGVWKDTRNNWKINTLKTVNLTVRSFMNGDLQSVACAMTYRTLLAIVPALALLFAIGRGFGLQNLILEQISGWVPAQRRLVEVLIKFVDSYLAQASEGIFVGVGIVFLLSTLVFLLMSVEEAFNQAWGVQDNRSIWRKLTDYTAILIILPILFICSSGISLFMSTALHHLLPFDFLSPVVTFVLEAASWVFIWLLFAGAYVLIPNAKVRFSNALIAGVLAGSAFRLLQWLFVSGQLYVAKYNAIYGSFSFLPLLLIWMQLTWLITLTGALVCCSSQNIYQFAFGTEIAHISMDYRRRMCLAVMILIVKRFDAGLPALDTQTLAEQYGLPPRLAEMVVARLMECGLVNSVSDPSHDGTPPVQPSMGTARYTVASVIRALRRHGDTDFVAGFDETYAPVNDIVDAIDQYIQDTQTTRLADIDIKV